MSQDPRPLVLEVQGLDCAEEVAILKRELAPLVGGSDHLSFDVIQGRMTVLPGAGRVDFAAITAAIGRTGMKARPLEPGRTEEMSWWRRHGRESLTATSAALTALAFVLDPEGASPPPLIRGLYTAAALAGMILVLPKAWFSLRRMRPDMNLLMTIAVCGAWGIGEWFEAATVACLFALSLTLESWSVGRARQAIEKLFDLTPPLVRVKDADGVVRERPPAEVPLGSLFQVRPGERIALDGEVTAGISDVNQAAITGESVAVLKEPGAPVFAGTINGAGTLEVRSSRVSGDTTLARIVRLVEQARQNRAPAERWVDRFAEVYTPAVVAAAAAVFLFPTLVLGQPFAHWLYQSLVLLVIACPCALVISTPVSVVAALAAAARQGVLVKGGAQLEKPATLQAVAFDKTGTLTAGRPTVVQVVALNGHTEAELLERAAAMESHSDHPLARAIVEYATARGVAAAPAERFAIIPGKGATARYQGREFWLGSHRFLEERGQETPAVHAQLEELSRNGHTVVVIGNDDHVCGFLALADQIRPEAQAAVADLRRAGVAHIVMLSGDNSGTAHAIARQAGIDDVRADLLPADKMEVIADLVARHGAVAMVGDGINDAPALSLATLGIAMGAAGSDTALEAADVALMADDLAKIPWLIGHSRRMLRVIRANIALSLAVKAAFAALTLFGHATLWMAIAADTGVSLLVIFNALRLLRG